VIELRASQNSIFSAAELESLVRETGMVEIEQKEI
jgi:hypothetical protein